MSSSEEKLLQICNDLDPDFVRSLSIGMGWQYRALFERLAEHSHLPDDYKCELFNRGRGDAACAAIAHAAKQHAVPFEFLRLSSNGQRKLVVRAGRVVLIQEPIVYLDDSPKVADYKLSLADAHGYMRQLELDLGDRPYFVKDWSGCVLAVLLHGAAGQRFNEKSKNLGSLTLGIPDAAYTSWTLRVDLRQIAMHGKGIPETAAPEKSASQRDDQEDKVVVKLKRKNDKRMGEP